MPHHEIAAFLRGIPHPSKALLTSRERHYIGELDTALYGMNKDEAVEFVRSECKARGIQPISEEDSLLIHEATNGLPLAMQFIIGLIAVYGYRVAAAIRSAADRGVLLDFILEDAYTKLSDGEKKILHVMTIFAESAPAEVIGAASSIKEAHLSVGLGKLYSLFLVNKDDSGRYDILAPTRYFLQRITQEMELEGEPLQAFMRNAYRNLAQYYFAVLKDKNIRERITFLKPDRANVLASMQWCYDNQEPQLVIDLMSMVGYPLGVLGYWNDRIVWGRRAMEASAEVEDWRSCAWYAIHDVGWTHLCKGEIDVARELIEDYVRFAKENGFRRVKALGLRNLGCLARDIEENHDKALKLLEKSLAIWEEERVPEWIAITKSSLGVLQYKLGNFDEAQRFLEEALDAKEKQVADIADIVENLSDLGQVALAQGDFDRAKALSDRSLALAEELTAPAVAYAYALSRRAQIEEHLGNLAKASEMSKRAYESYKRLGAKYAMMEPKRVLERLGEQVES